MKTPGLLFDSAASHRDDRIMIALPDDSFAGESWVDPCSDDLAMRAAPAAGQGNDAATTLIVPSLSAKGITSLGIIDGRSATDGIVIGKRGEAMMICFNRPTRILMADGWRCFGPHTACALASPVSLRTRPVSGWAAAYVCYQDTGGFPDLSGHSVNFSAAPLVQAIRGLHAEAAAESGHALLHHWIELIHGYVTSLARPHHVDERVLKAWKIIASDLRRDWSVEEMAATAMMSAEHFRRLCLKTLGQSPMMHLSRLRVERAGELLRCTDLKIESICEEVGYEYRSTFSNIFTKFTGMRPSAYRSAAHAPSGGLARR